MEKVAKRKYSRPPTLKQIKALQFINQGNSPRRAMIKAGYSLSGAAAHPGRDLFAKDGVKRMISTMAGELASEGLTMKYMVGKFKEWLEATKSTNSFTEPDKNVPDYAVQLKAYQEWKKIMDQYEASINPEGQQIKRRLTIDEFVTGKEEGGVEDVIIGGSD